MAVEELEEEIIIIEDTDAANELIDPADSIIDEKESNTNKKPLVIIGISVIIILIISITLLLLPSSKDLQTNQMDFIEDRLDDEHVVVIPPTKIESMIAKANYLYASGSKPEALSLYEQIAQYSEAVSAYNLGVAQLKDSQYDLALQSFKKAILNNEKRCVSAINAAVCSLHLKDETSFKYYIELAHAYLSAERQSPLYSYYYSLINYYNKNYLEALSALRNPTTKEYIQLQNTLSAKINAMFNNDYDAIQNVENNLDINRNTPDDFSLGLLYARVGDLTLSKKYLKSAIVKNIKPMKAQIALSYINLKAGNMIEASKELENITDMFPDDVYKPYPIKVKLKDSLFDTVKAQKRYRNFISSSKEMNYQKIFYFSPYKIFNANKTISYIRKGNANIYIDNVDSAQEYLKKSTSSSNVNIGITKAIKEALAFKLRRANSTLQDLVKIQPKHSILQYNLALTYAQMGDMPKAYKHFLLSYNLDAKNYQSAIYAGMSAQIINKDTKKLLEIIKDSISKETESENTDFLNTLLNISQNNMFATADWLNNDYKRSPLYLTMDTIISLSHSNYNVAKQSTKKLTILLPNEILPHMMYIDAHFESLGTKEYANKVMNYLKAQKLVFDDLYYGAYITRYLYIQQNLITGKLYYLREQLKSVLESTTGEPHDLTTALALALASLYDNAPEEAYTLYNNLIDNLKIRDSRTLFLGAVASTAANHHANAIALLELAKMKDTNNLESRYALGLLYMEIKNNDGAIIQFSRINKSNFSSGYFNFIIDTNQLLLARKVSN